MTTFVSSGIAWGPLQSGITVAQIKTRYQAVHDAIVGCGIVQTADTGQLDINAIASVITGNYGFRTYRFADSVQGTDPLFFKIWYGSEGNTGICRFQITTGTGTNGTGTLTGQQSVTATSGYPWSGANNSPTVQLHSCHTDGFFMLAVGFNSTANGSINGAPLHVFSITRTRDDAGSFDGKGNLIWCDQGWGDSPYHSLTFTKTSSPTSQVALNQHYCVAPGNPASSALTNGDLQLYPHFYNDPDIKQMWSQFSAIVTGAFSSTPTTFTATPMYNTPRTFLGCTVSPRGEYNQSACRVMFLWE